MEIPLGEFPDSISIPTIGRFCAPFPHEVPLGCQGRIDYIRKFLVLLKDLGLWVLNLGGRSERRKSVLRRAGGTSLLLILKNKAFSPQRDVGKNNPPFLCPCGTLGNLRLRSAWHCPVLQVSKVHLITAPLCHQVSVTGVCAGGANNGGGGNNYSFIFVHITDSLALPTRLQRYKENQPLDVTRHQDTGNWQFQGEEKGEKLTFTEQLLVLY